MSNTEDSTSSTQNIDVGELIGLYQSNSSSRNNLWSLYVVATFAACGFVVTAQGDVGNLARVAMSLGFLAFTIGHGFLLYRVSSIRLAMQRILNKVKGHPLQPILNNISYNQSNQLKMAFLLIPHVTIDICVIVIIWSKPLCELLKCR